ncbi:MAG: hypothetical protein AAGJ94_01690 [Pseudomonadota bacterium]
MPARSAIRGAMTIAFAQSVCVLYILIWCLFPPLAIDAVWRYGLVAAFGAWCCLEGLRNGFQRFANGPAGWTLLFLSYTVVIQLMVGGFAEVVRGIQLHIALACALVAIAYRGRRFQELEWLIAPVLVLMAITLIKTLSALLGDPHAARTVVRTSPEALSLLRSGVGGYQTVYVCAVLAPLFLVFVARGRWVGDALGKAVGLFMIASVGVVLAGGFGLAVFVLTLASGLALWAYRGGTRSLVVRTTLVIAALGVAVLAYEVVLNGAEHLAEGTKYAKKIDHVRQSLALGEMVGTASDRASRYVRSVDIFLSSPLFGVLSYEPVGKHSQILDTFARYGVFVGLLGVFILVRLPGWLLPPLPKGTDHAPIVLSSAAGLFLMFNNATAAHGAAVYLLAPMVAYAFGRRAFSHKATFATMQRHGATALSKGYATAPHMPVNRPPSPQR